jgi:hypothetical protein
MFVFIHGPALCDTSSFYVSQIHAAPRRKQRLLFPEDWLIFHVCSCRSGQYNCLRYQNGGNILLFIIGIDDHSESSVAACPKDAISQS